MAAPQVIRSTDVGAPELSGTAGALIGVLDYALVTTAGWTKSFSGTNKAVYRAPAGNRFYLRVDDTGTQTSRVVGYETMSDVDTGTGPFPTALQQSGGAYILKSNSGSSAARFWTVFVDAQACYIVTNTNFNDITQMTLYGTICFFGDILSWASGDAYGTMIIAGSSNAASGNNFSDSAGALSTTQAGVYLCRSYTQIGSSVPAAKFSNRIAGTDMGTAGLPYPDPVIGGLVLEQVKVTEPTAQVIRGLLPGVYAPVHNIYNTLVAGDTMSGTGALAGKTFEMVAGYVTLVAISLSDWRT